jgi:hypothetical protein
MKNPEIKNIDIQAIIEFMQQKKIPPLADGSYRLRVGTHEYRVFDEVDKHPGLPRRG